MKPRMKNLCHERIEISPGTYYDQVRDRGSRLTPIDHRGTFYHWFWWTMPHDDRTAVFSAAYPTTTGRRFGCTAKFWLN